MGGGGGGRGKGPLNLMVLSLCSVVKGTLNRDNEQNDNLKPPSLNDLAIILLNTFSLCNVAELSRS